MVSGLHIGKEDGSSLWWLYDQIRQTQGFHSGEQVRLEKGQDLPEAIVLIDAAFLTAIHQVAPRSPCSIPQPRAPVAPAPTHSSGWSRGDPPWSGPCNLWGFPALADRIASRIPVSWEEQLGRGVVEQLAPSDKRCADPERIAVLDQIVSALTGTGSGPGSPYTFVITVVDDPAVNAFAAPGGHIVIYQGLLKKTESPEELAGVLAHEIQHILQRHGTKALFREMSMRVLLAATVGDASGMTTILDAAQTIGALRYRRRDEEAADTEGMKAIQAARIDATGMIRMFDKLNESGRDMPGAVGYLSTHPPGARPHRTVKPAWRLKRATPRSRCCQAIPGPRSERYAMRGPDPPAGPAFWSCILPTSQAIV